MDKFYTLMKASLNYSLILVCFLICSCAFEPPEVPVAVAPLADGNKLDAGITYVKNGQIHVSTFYKIRWEWLVKAYGFKTKPPVTDSIHGITEMGKNDYIITIQVAEEFQRLDRLSKVSP